MPLLTVDDVKAGAVLPGQCLPLLGDVLRYCQLLRAQNKDVRLFSHAALVNKVVDSVFQAHASLDFRLKGSVLRTRDYIYTKVSRLVERARPILNGKKPPHVTSKFLVDCTELFDVFRCR